MVEPSKFPYSIGVSKELIAEISVPSYTWPVISDELGNNMVKLSDSMVEAQKNVTPLGEILKQYIYPYPPGPSLEEVKEQERIQAETNAKWFEWWQNLTPLQFKALVVVFRKSIFLTQYVTRDSDGNVTGVNFPIDVPEDRWQGIANSMNSPAVMVDVMTDMVPGFNTKIKPPCDCSFACYISNCDCNSSTIAYIIMHVNDSHKWSFAQIADWLDTLDVDLSFPIPE